MSRTLIACASTLVTLIAIDALWLTVLMGSTYKSYLGELMLAQPKLVPAALFYVLYTVGLVVFAVLPALRADDWRQAAALGALLGLVAYATYDLSNLATLRGWPLPLTLIDIAWGSVLSCVVASVGFAVAKRWG
ncbi:DUF2177 family protein [Massilia sp. DWR3-1-1]|uniref:DUF2177 family protein n=1 Tax=Massilia sp. DWR3-1-1 TaxID=2804559 RepID=UPI003CEAEF26